ncbi:hypothetical protein EYB26_000393 [Talaromyces marneffei]|uniref:uncharacterized protein n=1 Tax=Talaromyces marneffei TaxID=37727 RepID=UPI0012A954C1|nr:uncharacterized protein EYB26_000393 [Talaromyces marneffei]QGA12748.1 hypothetical protein EYB26_000393 [Talaromyces marneffei]
MASKHPRKDRVLDLNKRVKITDDMIVRPLKEPRFMPPYFGHEPLNPDLYAGEWALPSAIIPTMDGLPYDIEKGADEDLGDGEDDDDEEEIERIFNAMLAKTDDKVVGKPTTTSAPQSPTDPDRIVVGPRPVEGKGKKLCGLEDMDEDDKLIYYLKLAKWSERAIHEKFAAENRIGYNQKTIGTRFARMRRFIMAETDQRLKDGTTVWLEAEEKLLPEAVVYATRQINKECLALRQRKWALVSNFIQKREPLALYSGEACREHYETLMSAGESDVATSSDPKVSKLRVERLNQTALLEHFKRSECL